jgi:hypothetical protein
MDNYTGCGVLTVHDNVLTYEHMRTDPVGIFDKFVIIKSQSKSIY